MVEVDLLETFDEFPSEIRHGINALSQGISIFDKDLFLVFYNSAFLKILDLPAELLAGRTHFKDLIRFNTERGEYGDVDVQEKVEEIYQLALQFQPHKFIRTTARGITIEVKGVPIPSGGFVTTYTDVSELVDAREKYEKASEKFRDFTEAASDWYWETDENHCFSFFSERLEQVLNVPASSLLGKQRGKLAADEGDQKWIDHQNTINAHIPFTDFHYEIISSDGTTKFCSVSGKPAFGPDGRFMGYRGVGKEITDQVRSEQEREKAHADRIILSHILDLSLQDLPLNEILQRVLDGILQHSRRGFKQTGSIFLAEDKQKQFQLVACTGLPTEMTEKYETIKFSDFLGSENVDEKIKVLAGSDRNYMISQGHYCVPITRATGLLGILNLYVEKEHEQSDDEVQFLNSVASTLSGIISRWRTQDELRVLSQAIEQNPAAILVTDVEGTIYYANEALLKSSGYSREEVIGANPRIFQSGETKSEEYAKLWDTISAGRVWQGVLHNKTKSGEEIWERMLIVPIKNRSDQILNYVAIKENITESREQEKERERLENELRQAQKMEAVGQLAGGIAHEINTPTQYVSDNLKFLKDIWENLSELHALFDQVLPLVQDNEKAQKLLEDIQELKDDLDFEVLSDDVEDAISDAVDGTQQISRIVRAMKDFSHPGQKEMVMSDINRALTSTATVCKNEWKYVAHLDFELDDRLPQVQCLPGELNQVFLNMIVNAAHAIEERNKAEKTSDLRGITIRTRNLGETIEIDFQDEGSGIPAKIRDKVFNPFFTTKIVGKGTGQGLSISHDVIVNKHGGRIWFETEEGKGTTFKISLPVKGKDTATQESEHEE
ncbi:PAS-domain containing protein [Terasakiella sp.]|uniref:PAS-domain containing protein n=1 Tax=Terasakiella sp. TaxID=2034861 RepID=UPI003AA9B3DF